MTSDVKPVPDGLPTVIPHICIKGAAAAIDFYKKAFGATEIMARLEDAEGKVGHAELKIGNSVIYIADEHPEHGFCGPQTLGGSHMVFLVHVEDVDAAVEKAVACGATLTRPVANQFYGDRTGEVTDEFGYRWYLSTHVEDVSEEEMQRRAAQMG